MSTGYICAIIIGDSPHNTSQFFCTIDDSFERIIDTLDNSEKGIVMKRIVALLVMIVLAIGVSSGVSAEGTGTRIITDCYGAQVEIPNEINKVVVTSPAAVAFMTAMGLDNKIVGTHGAVLNHFWIYVFSDQFEGMPMYGKKPNAEELIAADVDLVIIKDGAYAEELRKQGITAVSFQYTDKEELYFAVDMLGEIFGDNAKAWTAAWEEKLDGTIAGIEADLSSVPDAERCNVYYVDATGAEVDLYLTAGGKSFVEYWINASGANLITSSYEGLEQIDQETALTLNPDTIFICGWLEYPARDAIMSDPLWQEVPAVKNNRVFIMPTSVVSYDRFAVDLPLMFDYTANMLYPELHSFDGVSALHDFYEEFYGKSFTDEQLELMLKGLNPDGTIMAGE